MTTADNTDRFTLIEGGLDEPDIIAMLRSHVERAHAEAPKGGAYALHGAALASPDIRFFSLREKGLLLSMGALKRLDADHAEIKSMFTAPHARRRGAAGVLMQHLIDVARSAGYQRLSLETGVRDYFIPARALYVRHGFTPCGPFGDYPPDAASLFFTRML